MAPVAGNGTARAAPGMILPNGTSATQYSAMSTPVSTSARPTSPVPMATSRWTR